MGTWLDISVYCRRPVTLLRFFEDITARRAHEMAAARLTRMYSVLSDCNQPMVRSRDPQEVFDGICRIAVRRATFAPALIGLIGQWRRTALCLQPATAVGAEWAADLRLGPIKCRL